MLTEPTIEKLYALRLGSMAAAFAEQQKDAKVSSLSFDERFGLLVDAEHLARDNRRIKTLLKDAELRIPSACLEDVDASAQRGIDRALLRQLASGAWVDQSLNTPCVREVVASPEPPEAAHEAGRRRATPS